MQQAVNIDVDVFCSWLCAHEHDAVGQPGIWFHSPLALWLSEVTGVVYGVDGVVYGRACWDERWWLPLPRWAALFSICVEQWLGQTMIGSEALEVLAHVERSLSLRSGHRERGMA